jgi:molybdopterin/thiamine biosynthesis adenylyltransferase
VGVLGVVPGQIGLMQATEAIKLILGKGKPLIGRILIYDALDADIRVFSLKKNEKCPLCGVNPVITEPVHSYYRAPVAACTV